MNPPRLFIPLISATLLIAGCFDGATRHNPLDPLSENFLDEGGLTIQVTTFYPPRTGLAGVDLFLEPSGLTRSTNGSGDVSFEGLTSGSYTLTASKADFETTTHVANIRAGERTRVEIPMAGLPTFSAFQVTAVHVSRWFPPPEELFSIEIRATLNDADGIADIDSVWVLLPDFAYEQLIAFQTAPGQYFLSIPSTSLPANLESLFGRSFQLRAKDRAGFENLSDPQSFVRVIRETPLAIEPQGLAELSTTQPSFEWESISLDFPFSYRIDIVRVDQNIQSTVQVIENIPSTSTTTNALESLSSGEYFWTVSIVDEFGNRSRSREAGFRIP